MGPPFRRRRWKQTCGASWSNAGRSVRGQPCLAAAAPLSKPARPIGGVSIRGYVDLLDVDGRVIDLKTAKKTPSEKAGLNREKAPSLLVCRKPSRKRKTAQCKRDGYRADFGCAENLSFLHRFWD